jgi:pSer/pThr/pTyr-binding forkhead associated (FHA) protein
MVEVKLKVQAGSNAGKEIPVPMARFLIGRSDECQLRPKSDAISRNHCTILTNEDEVTVRDLNSRNGTFVNGERVSGDQPLKNGDMLRVGKLEFEVVILGKAKQQTVPAPDTKTEKKAEDGSSVEFDVSEWLEEANAVANQKRSDPDTRQFKLDETDRIALGNSVPEPSSTGDSGVKKIAPPEKRAPGKLPDRQKQAAANSREAAADMLKKFFNNSK